MLNKNFIKLNIDDKHLSLGNLFRVIKEEANNNNIWQSDLFCIIFSTENIADSTVNNYCTGFRSINPKYKNYIKELKFKFDTDNLVLLPIVGKILELTQNNQETFNSLQQINENNKLKHICNRLYSISKNDTDVSTNLSDKLYSYLEANDYYNFICTVLFFVILDKKQPINVSNTLNDVIENNIYGTNISVYDVEDFIKFQLNSGIWSIRGIQQLAQKGNPFACFEMASMEFYGIITGKARYEKAYEYYKIAANYNHPVSHWAIGYLYYNGYIGNKSKRDLYLAFKYFNKARKLKCSNAYNSLGLILLNGNIPHIKRNKQKAIKMFETAISIGNIYAYNNLGKIYEDEKDYKKAFEYYIVSAAQGESWAANRVGEFYRKGIARNKDLKKAFEYYEIASQSPKFTLYPWAKYNLAKYFYLNGNLEIGISKDLNKAIQLLEDISDELAEARSELDLLKDN